MEETDATLGEISFDKYTSSVNIYDGSQWNDIQTSVFEDPKPSLKLTEDGSIQLGDDFEITVEQLIPMLKTLLKLSKEDRPEDFI